MLKLNKLYLMDCMEGMKQFPDKYFELAVVDPPYGISISNNIGRRKRYKPSGHKKVTWDSLPPDDKYFDEFADGGTDVPDPHRAGREKLHLAAVANRQGYPSGPDASGRAERPAQPRLGRMDDGIPARLDGCGRAIRNPAAQSAVVGHRASDPEGGGGNPAPGRSAEMPGKRGSPRAVLPDFCGDCGGNGGRQK